MHFFKLFYFANFARTLKICEIPTKCMTLFVIVIVIHKYYGIMKLIHRNFGFDGQLEK